MRPHFDLFADRYSERNERKVKAEKAEAKRLADEAAANGALGENAGPGAEVVNGVNIKNI